MGGRSSNSMISQPAGDVNFNGGLNSAGGNLSLQDNESSDLLNVDFNFLGSVLKRNGYTALNTTSLSGGIDSYTVLMLHMNGVDASTTFTDSSFNPHIFTAHGTAQIDTAQSVFGGASGLFDGNSDYITSPDSDNWNLGSSNFTIDFRVRFAALTAGDFPTFIGQYDVTGQRNWETYFSVDDNKIFFDYSLNGSSTMSTFEHWTPVINTWYAIRLVRTGNTLIIFINGIKLSNGNSVTGSFYDSTAVLSLGVDLNSGSPQSGDYLNGWLDEVRLDKGVARSIDDYIVPAYQYEVASSSDGLHWYEFNNSGTLTYYLINVIGGKIYYMTGFDGTWHDITGSVTITAGSFCSFKNFFNVLYITNGTDAPFQWTGSGNATIIQALTANAYTFTVSGVSVTPTAGATYTNNTVTFTVVSASLVGGAGTIIATGAGAPSASGTLTKTGGTGDSTITFTLYGVDANITKAKYVEAYNNYVFLANVSVGSTTYPTRLYWSNLQDPTTFLTTSFIEVAMNDGQQITGMKVLGDNLIIFKTRSIYTISFTGDPDIPFILQAGGKSNSDVGCVSPFSIQEVTNGLVFLSFDGLYYFDGSNSTKMSDRINPTILGLNNTRLSQARSMVQHNKHRYLISVPSSSSTTNDTVITWDWYLNAFSVYSGINASSMCTTFTSGYNEKLYFGDYAGFYYQMDNGPDDYPLNVQTAINGYYYTNWKVFQNIMDEKAIPNTVLYYQTNNAVLTFAYSYDFNTSDTYSLTLNTGGSTSVYGTGVYGTATYAGTGGDQQRIDLNGRGRTVRFGWKNNNIGETFRIDGLGEFPNVETQQ